MFIVNHQIKESSSERERNAFASITFRSLSELWPFTNLKAINISLPFGAIVTALLIEEGIITSSRQLSTLSSV